MDLEYRLTFSKKPKIKNKKRKKKKKKEERLASRIFYPPFPFFKRAPTERSGGFLLRLLDRLMLIVESPPSSVYII